MPDILVNTHQPTNELNVHTKNSYNSNIKALSIEKQTKLC